MKKMQCQKIDAKAMPALGCETLLLFFAARCVLLPLPIYHLAALGCFPLLAVSVRSCLQSKEVNFSVTKKLSKKLAIA